MSTFNLHVWKTNTNLIYISFLILAFFVSYYGTFIVQAQEETITIVPGSSDSSRYRFFDITEYPLNTGEELKWYNADNIVHNIIVTSNDGDIIVAQSGNINRRDLFLINLTNLESIFSNLQTITGWKVKSL